MKFSIIFDIFLEFCAVCNFPRTRHFRTVLLQIYNSRERKKGGGVGLCPNI